MGTMADADNVGFCLKGRDLIELGRCSAPQPLIEVVGEYPPLALRIAGVAADPAGANAIERARILDGQRLEHYGIDERKDCSRGADAQSEGEDRRDGENGRAAHLTQTVSKIAQQGREHVRLSRAWFKPVYGLRDRECRIGNWWICGSPKAFVFFSLLSCKSAELARNRRRALMPRRFVCFTNAEGSVS